MGAFAVESGAEGEDEDEDEDEVENVEDRRRRDAWNGLLGIAALQRRHVTGRLTAFILSSQARETLRS